MLWYCCGALLGWPHELPLGAVVAFALGLGLHRRCPSADLRAVAGLSLAVAGVVLLLVISVLALQLQISPSWFVPFSPGWVWLASAVCCVVALDRRAQGTGFAVAGLVVGVCGLLFLGVWLYELLSHPW